MQSVRQERTGWRDEALSLRHRQWGFDCPAVDIDFLLCEYDSGKVSGLIEYKNEHANLQYASHPTYRALIDLGNKADIPVIACRYSDDLSKYRGIPLNECAKKFIPERKDFDEVGWVTLLYKIRGREMPYELLEKMNIEI